MPQYMYYQDAPAGEWKETLAENRAALEAAGKLALCTVLTLDTLFVDGMTPEQLSKIKYKGPFYADFDCNEDDGGLAAVIEKFKYFLQKLEKLDVNLDQVALYATGGRGFHALVPQEVFMTRPPAGGQVFLPHIYKLMANAEAIYVNTLDVSIYSARRGRMLRVANVRRKEGTYKVAISVAEAKAMTLEMYQDLTKQPRPLLMLAPPTLAGGLAFEFQKASEQNTKGVKRKATNKVDEKVLEQCEGDFPPSALRIMNGEVREGLGFNQIALQLGCIANALGKTQDEFVAACDGLIQNHVGDGVRYNTPAKRRAELYRMYYVTNDSNHYSFSVGGLKSCAREGDRCLDLRDTSVDDTEAPETDEGPELDVDDSMASGMTVNRLGIFKKTDGVQTRVSHVGLVNPKRLIDTSTGGLSGYEVEVYLEGKFLRKDVIDLGTFTNKARFEAFITYQDGAGVFINDNTRIGVQEILRNKVKGKGSVYTVGQEGIDIVKVRDPQGEFQEEVIYVAKDKIESLSNWHDYRLRSLYSGDNGQMDCDIHHAPPLTDTPQTRQFFSKFMKLNAPGDVARCFGWYMSAFLSPMIRKLFDQYPILQVVGQAGAGKSKYTDLLMGLHYYQQKPRIFSASSLTAFALESTLNSSSSIPIIFDELKASEIDKRLHDRLKTAFRANYNGRMASKGRVDYAKVKDALSAAGLHNRAPLSFIGEALESQTAIVDRCVVVNLTEKGREGTRDDFEWCSLNRKILSSLGRLCVDAALRINMDALSEAMQAKRKLVQDSMPARASNMDRPAFNNMVPLIGLDFAKSILKRVFGEAFSEVFGTSFEDMQAQVLSNLEEYIPRNLSEGSKVLNTLAHISHYGRDQDMRLIAGEDYMYWKDSGTGRDCIDIKMRIAYDKYRKYMRSIGEDPLYVSYEAMAAGLRNHPTLVSRSCHDNDEFRSSVVGSVIYRFDINKMASSEGLQEFDSIPVASTVVKEFPKGE